MPISDGNFVIPDFDTLYQRQRDELESRFPDASVGFGDYTQRIIEAQAQTLAEYQYQALQSVYEGAYLEDATGEELGKLVRLIGLSRREPTPASGVARFIHDGPVDQDYLIQRGTTVSTGGQDAISYETTQQRTLAYYDGFEDGDIAEYDGDVASFSVVNGRLELPATSGVTIYRDDVQPSWGTQFEFDFEASPSSTVVFMFGVDNDASDYYAVSIDDVNDSLHIYKVEGGTETTLQSTNYSVVTGETEHATVDWRTTGEIVFTIYDTDAKETERASISHQDTGEHRTEGGIGYRKDDANAVSYIDNVATSEVSVAIEAVEGGVETNVGAGAITVLTDGTTGVDDLTNPYPTGDNSFVDTLNREFQVGRDRETDEELRDRAFESTALGGTATKESINAALRELDNVFSVSVFENKTADDNTGTGGLPPHSFEAVVYGGIDRNIARTLHDTKAITARDYGGAHGNAESYTFYSDELEQDVTYNWSSPIILELGIEVDLVVDDTYVGDDELRSRIVNYVGGTDVDGATIGGLGVEEDLYVGVLKDIVTGPDDTGVWDADFTTIDSTGDGNDDTTTATNGATILDVGEGEAAETNGRDNSIVINTTQK